MLVWVKLPTKKSTPARSRSKRRINCNLMTHLTPATLITDNNITAAQAKPRWAQVDSKPTRPAIDSPKPKTFRAQPTA